MRRVRLITGLGLVAVVGAIGWQSLPGAATAIASLPTRQPQPEATPSIPKVEPPAPMVEIIGDREVAAPGARGDDDGAAPVPVPSDAVVAALRDSMKNGDPRMPPLARSDDLREMPSREELADPALYQAYEQRQNQKVYASFVSAASHKISDLEARIARAEAAGLPAEQLEEGRQKLAGLRAQRDEILQTHPEVAAGLQSSALAGQE